MAVAVDGEVCEMAVPVDSDMSGNNGFGVGGQPASP
jgi:hypothetical protein